MKNKFKFLALAIMALLSVNVWGAEDTATGSSTLQAATTYYDLQSGKLIECKNSASNTYPSPVRIYADNTFTFHCKTGAEKITKIVIVANSNDYATTTKNATWSASGTGTCSATATVSSSTVTVTVTGTATTVTCKPSAQVRWNSATVTYTTSVPAAKYTVTFNAGSGTCSTSSLPESTAGAGVTLPAASPSSACGTDGWTFAGWATASQAETTTAPTLYAANSNYKPSSNCTLYAVYKITEGGGPVTTKYTLNGNWTTDNGNWSVVSGSLNSSLASGKYGINSGSTSASSPQAYTSVTSVKFTGTKSSSGAGSVEVWYKSGNSWVTLGSKSFSTSLTWTPTTPVNGELKIQMTRTAGNLYIASIDVSYTSGTTTYNSNPSCATCANLITITKGTPYHGSFTLTEAGTDICADEPVTVSLSNITADAHYHATTVTTSATTGGGSPSAISGGSASVTGITASTTINVTFAEDTKVTVTLLNNNAPVNAGGFDAQGKKEYYTGETLGTLPTLTSDDACDSDSNHFMGWTTEQITTKRGYAPDFVNASTPVTPNMILRAVWAKAE